MRKWCKGARYLLLILLAVVSLVMAGCSSQDESAKTEELPEYTLYWNVDRDKHRSTDGSPVERRKPGEDGNYTIRLFKDGQTQEFKVADRKMVDAIDSSYLVPTVVDENGTITQILDLFDLDISLRALYHYVYQIDGNVVQTNSSYRYDGNDDPLVIESYTNVYDMTGTSGPEGTLTNLVEDDRIIAVEDTDGRLTDVFVYVRMGTTTRIKRYCEHCQAEVVWTHWYKEDSVPVVNGHYYLVTDVELAKQGSIKQDQKICLDLNGHTITGGENQRIYSCHYANTELAIFDFSEEKTGKLVAWGTEGAQGGCVWIRYGKFSLYGGTLDGSGYTSVVNGAAVSVPKNAQFDMYGGTIIGGTAIPTVSETGKVSYGMGGAVCVGGTFHMHDGQILDGNAKSAYDKTTGKYAVGYGGNVMVLGGIFNMHDGVISGGLAEGGGGNVYVVSGGEFNMLGGEIRNGTSVRKNTNGGNVTVAVKSKMRMEGGTICDGVATLYGGNLRVDGTMDMLGGEIYGGKIYDEKTNSNKKFDHSENVYFPKGNFNMSGGHIHGGFLVLDAAANDKLQPELYLTGEAKIYGAPKGESNLKISTNNDGVITKVGTFSGTAKIGLTATGLFSEKTAKANKNYCFVDYPGLEVGYYQQRLLIGRVGCQCGQKRHIGECSGKNVAWGAVLSDEYLPSTTGYYYLVQNVTLSRQLTLAENAEVVYDLNGHSIRMDEGRAMALNKPGSLTIVDSVGTGKVSVRTQKNDNGMVVNVNNAKAVFNLYGGTLDGTGVTNGNNGAIVNVAGSMNMYGGKIIGGKGVNGGAVRLSNEDATLLMTGGTITGGSAKRGGAIFNSGKIQLRGGFIIGGSADNGGAIYNVGTVNISGGAISGGTVSGQGSAIYSGGPVKMTGGSIVRGDYVKAAVIYQTGENALFEISGGELDGMSEGTGAQMGAITAWTGSTVTVNGGTIQGNPKSVYAYSATVNIQSGTVAGNQLYISGDVEAQLPSAIYVTGGEIPKEIYLRYGVAHISGNPVMNGLNFYDEDQKVTIGTLTEGADVPVKASGYQNKVHPNYILTDVNALTYMHESTNTFGLSWLEGKGLYIGKVEGIRTACAVCAGAYDKCEHTQLVEYLGVSSLPVQSGYYYLADNISLEEQWTIAEGVEIVLDLNGKTIESAKRAIGMNEASSLTITDSVGGGAILAKTEVKDNGMLINVNNAQAILNLYAGTLDGSGVTNGNNGAAINVSGSMYMYGGTVIGATAVSGANGGAVRISNENAKLELLGGTIHGGRADRGGAVFNNGTVQMSGGDITGGNADNGGAIYNAGTLNMSGGTITGGTVSGQGSAIYNGGTVTVSDGTVIRGQYNNAAVVYQKGEKALFEISGGVLDGMEAGTGAQMGAITAWTGSIVTVNGGTIQGNPKSIYAYSATVNIQSGTVTGNQLYISGDATAQAPSTIHVTGGEIPKEIYLRYGSANISGNPVMNGLNFYDENQKVTIGTLTEGADVPVKALKYQNSVHPNYILTDVNALAYMHEATNTYDLSWVEGEGLYIGMQEEPDDGKACALCAGAYENCKHEQRVEYTGITSLPTVSGYYYLTENITLQGQWSVPEGANIVLDLRGKTIESPKRAIALNKAANLTITDSLGGGVIAAKTATKDNGMVLNVNNTGAVVTMYAGTLDGSGVTNGNNGVAVNVAGTYKMYGGIIIGGKGATGGCVRVNNAAAVFEMYGGAIYGGKTSGLGHNLYIRSCQNTLLAGGQIAGGVYYEGGILQLGGDIVIDNALTAQFGEELYVPSYSLKMPTSKTAEVSGNLASQARIVLSLAGSSVSVNNVAEESQCACFFLTDTDCVRTYDPDTLTLTLTPKE